MPCPVTGRAFFYGRFSRSICWYVEGWIETTAL
jgi:hypothetical protein